MDKHEFDNLPAGSVVSHEITSYCCTYRKRKDGNWQVAELAAPHKPKQSSQDADLRRPGSLTLVRHGKAPSTKDQRIADLETEIQRLRTVIRVAQSYLNDETP